MPTRQAGRSDGSAGKAQRRVFEERRPHRSDRAETGRRRGTRGRRGTGRRFGDATPEGNATTDAAPPRGHSIASSPTLDEH